MFGRFVLMALALLASAVLTVECQSGTATYPSRPIEMVIHSAAGGGSDLMGRMIADTMAKEKIVSQPISVVNKPGGSSAVATAYVYEKKGNPYYLYTVTTVHVAASLKGDSKIKVQDLTPLVSLAADSESVVVSAKSPYKTLKDLIDASKKGKSKMAQAGSSLTGSDNRTGFAIRKATGADWEFVSYKSGGEAITAVLGGHNDLCISNPIEVVEQLRAGTVRILSITGAKRLEIWPDVPTLTELGIPEPPTGFRAYAMPPGVPPETVKYWENAFQKFMATQAWKQYVKENALTEVWMDSKTFTNYINTAAPKFESIMKEMGLLK